MSIKNKRPPKLHVGDLVTRSYNKNLQIVDNAYGIILELYPGSNKRSPPSALVYWFKDDHSFLNTKRVSNSRFLRLVNSAKPT